MVLPELYILTSIMLKTALGGKYYYLFHFTDGKTEAR